MLNLIRTIYIHINDDYTIKKNHLKYKVKLILFSTNMLTFITFLHKLSFLIFTTISLHSLSFIIVINAVTLNIHDIEPRCLLLCTIFHASANYEGAVLSETCKVITVSPLMIMDVEIQEERYSFRNS